MLSSYLFMETIPEISDFKNGRLQNSPYFCVFKYARAVKQKVWNEAENRERDWGETLKIRTVFFSRLTRFARVRLLRHALPISLLILRKKPTVLQSTKMDEFFIVHRKQQSCVSSLTFVAYLSLFRDSRRKLFRRKPH